VNILLHLQGIKCQFFRAAGGTPLGSRKSRNRTQQAAAPLSRHKRAINLTKKVQI
jgi:hypothetical protein